MIYLASPYTHPDKQVEQLRFEQACYKVADMAQQGLHVYSPIVHWHPVALAHALPTDHLFWIEQNHEMIKLCDSLYVLLLDGWEDSKGIADETHFAHDNHLPIIYTDLRKRRV